MNAHINALDGEIQAQQLMTTFGTPAPPHLTIDQITTTPFRLPMIGALQWGKHSVLNEAHHVLIEVTLSDGSSGMAEAPPRPTIYGETVQSICGIIADELAPRLCGEPVAHSFDKVHEVKNNQTAKGALNMAIHSALAQHHGQSLRTYLGATTERIQVSYILGIGERESMLAEAERVFAQGVRVLKVKVGRDWQHDLTIIDELREQFGDQMLLYADANETLAAAEASTILCQLRDHGLLYCEEPLPVELIRERACLRAEQIVPLIADDSCFSQRDLQRELAMDTFDILNIKTARTGYSESHAMLNTALAAGKGIMIGSQASTGLGTLHAAYFAGLAGINYPSELSFFLKLREDILDSSIPLHDGYLHLAELEEIAVDPTLLAEATV